MAKLSRLQLARELKVEIEVERAAATSARLARGAHAALLCGEVLRRGAVLVAVLRWRHAVVTMRRARREEPGCNPVHPGCNPMHLRLQPYVSQA